MGLFATLSITETAKMTLVIRALWQQNNIMLNVVLNLLCWMSLCWMSLFWMSVCWMSLFWVTIYWVSLCWVSVCWVSVCLMSLWSVGMLNVVAPLLAESNVCMPLVKHLNLNYSKMTLLKTNALAYLTRQCPREKHKVCYYCKNFTSVNYECLWQVRVFVPGKPFLSSLFLRKET
jgi:hypothetical protein